MCGSVTAQQPGRTLLRYSDIITDIITCDNKSLSITLFVHILIVVLSDICPLMGTKTNNLEEGNITSTILEQELQSWC